MKTADLRAETRDLRRSLRDLLALSALPSVWEDHDPNRIAASVTTVLAAMLDAAFVYVAVPGGSGEAPTEAASAAGRDDPALVELIREALTPWLPERASARASIINPLGPGELALAYAPVGFGSDAVMVAASLRPGFPTQTQRLLLGTGANEAAIALHRWQAESDGRRFASLVDRSSDFVGVAGLGGQVRYVNPAGLRRLGLASLEVATGLDVWDFIMPEAYRWVRDEIWPQIMTQGRWSGELNLRHFVTGAPIPFLVEAFRVDDWATGEPINISTVSRDLTAQKQAEAELRHLNETLEQRVADRTLQLARTNERLTVEMLEHKLADARLQQLQSELMHAARLSTAGQMAAVMAHELSQPLSAAANSVNAARRLLARGDHGLGVVAEILDEANEQVARASQIIGRMRGYVARGEIEPRLEDTAALIEGTRSLVGADGVELDFRFDAAAPRVFADRVQIQQVLVNLMRNALDSMVGRPDARIVVRAGPRPPGFVEISVADDGPGISREVMTRLFEPFYSTKAKGVGLGLAICRSIVEAHGGALWAESPPGGGARFHFTLPAGTEGTPNVQL